MLNYIELYIYTYNIDINVYIELYIIYSLYRIYSLYICRISHNHHVPSLESVIFWSLKFILFFAIEGLKSPRASSGSVCSLSNAENGKMGRPRLGKHVFFHGPWENRRTDGIPFLSFPSSHKKQVLVLCF